jgi:hypothetical protein
MPGAGGLGFHDENGAIGRKNDEPQGVIADQ